MAVPARGTWFARPHWVIDKSGNRIIAATTLMSSPRGWRLSCRQLAPSRKRQRPPAAAPETATDRLGRTTPKGTVEGFLGAARRGEDDLARQYLNTRQTGEAGAALAHQLFVVLDRRMRGLPELSDAPEGSANPDSPGLEIIGSVESVTGRIDIVLEQQQRADGGLIWLFSRATLQAVPAVYEEIVIARSAEGPAPAVHEHPRRGHPPDRVGRHVDRPRRVVSGHKAPEPRPHGAGATDAAARHSSDRLLRSAAWCRRRCG